jgi:hypothetical protein
MSSLDSTGVPQDRSQLANHQTDSKPSPPSITNIQQQQSFEATTAAMDTNELLHMIIAEVPLEYRTAIRGVSKTWKAAVTKVGYTLDPIGYDNRYPENLHLPMIQLEPHNYVLANNPLTSQLKIYSCSSKDKDNRHERMCYYHSLKCEPSFHRKSEELFWIVPSIVGHEHEFITNPPVTQVTIAVTWRQEEGAILRIPGGIRMGDLVGTASKLIQNDENLNHVHWSVGSAFISKQDDDEHGDGRTGSWVVG